MKFGIITFHRALNYGAVFQTLALQKSLNRIGIENEVIDYRCEFIEKHYAKKRLKDLINIKQFISDLIHNRIVYNNRINFDSFIIENIQISHKKYQSKKELVLSNDLYDKIITGSDQVWNYISAGFDYSYFLDFVDNEKKNAYAASFGVDILPNDYLKKYIDLLKDFKLISVRENSGKIIINDLLNIDVPVVLDPTLLLTSEDWDKYSSVMRFSFDYILIYLITESDTLFNFAERIAIQYNLKILYINDKLFERKGVINLRLIKPSEWIWLFKNAKHIVTNSYHGVLFSINFNKDFFVELLPSPAKVNSRIIDIIEHFQLNDRFITNEVPVSQYNKIDYSKVNLILHNDRFSSINFLNKLNQN